jgi:hypothetical protein
MSSQTCVRCGVFLSTQADVTYSDEGDPMCVVCRERIDRERKEAREARTLTAMAVSSLAGSVIGLPIAFIFVLGGVPFSLPAFGSARMCLKALQDAPPGVLTALGPRAQLIKVAATVATGLGGLGVAVMVVQIVAVLIELANRPR